ncbi:hypothetical protein ACH4FX_12015 [Streptomyces sp. NPDC018019]|uniref:hypothetical protein n=1 Tax=Streptomyces sp. NPDC018019 TaxID=3365030 RepID=UPI0037BA5199
MTQRRVQLAKAVRTRKRGSGGAGGQQDRARAAKASGRAQQVSRAAGRFLARTAP